MPDFPLQPDDFVEDVVRVYPEASTFLRRWDIICIQCGEPIWGTLKEIIEEKQQDVTQVLALLNKFLEKQAD
ncbi:MAG: DUF1858 domain-containing protein [Deltaproteobacteria bacterium]|nr:DUF1858 domain-containing protein [Deltaproteobacteria bacterium]